MRYQCPHVDPPPSSWVENELADALLLENNCGGDLDRLALLPGRLERRREPRPHAQLAGGLTHEIMPRNDVAEVVYHDRAIAPAIPRLTRISRQSPLNSRS
jgi:hypothetical protein